jgi:hypothetical protein
MECSICLNTINNDNIKTQCGHDFHYTCLKKCKGDLCPLCRTKLENIMPPMNELVPLMDNPLLKCECCGQFTWLCNECFSRICDCGNGVGCKQANPIEEYKDFINIDDQRCIDCYMNRDNILLNEINKVNGSNIMNVLSDMHDMYFSFEVPDKNDMFVYLMDLIGTI